ncbi:hypothetical protein PMAYCL1PPCAC_15852, partial [Pristionchus mayeri]
PRSRGNGLTLNLDIFHCHSLHIRLKDIGTTLNLEYTSTRVGHLGLIGHLRQSILADDFEDFSAQFFLELSPHKVIKK